MKIALIAVTVLSLAAGSVSAATKATPRKSWEAAALEALKAAEDVKYDAGKAAALVKSRKAGRRIASDALTDADLSPAFRTFRDEFLAIRNAAELDALLGRIETNYNRYPNDVKFFAAQLAQLKVFRGIVYRLRPVFENHNRSVHSVAVTQLKTIASMLRIYLPTPQWEAGFEYLTVPSPRDAQNEQFHTVADFQEFLMAYGIPSMMRAKGRLVRLFENRGDHPYVWDNKLYYGTGSFADDLDRYRSYDYPEMSATIGSIDLSIHSALMFCAYNMDDLLNVSEALGRLAGINGFMPGVELGVSAKDRTQVIKRYPNFLTLKNSPEGFGRDLMGRAYNALSEAVSAFDTAWIAIDARGGSPEEFAVLDPAQYAPSRRYINSRLNNMKAMVAGATTLRSPVTGETARFDLRNFYSAPPADLKLLLPINFDNGPRTRSVTSESGRSLEYRNYFRGRATGWKITNWSPYAPDLTQPAQVAKTLRVVRHNWGSEYVAAPLDFVIR